MKTIHVSVDIDYLLCHTDAELARWLVPAEPMTGVQIRAYLHGLKAQGFEAVPTVCPNPDDKGHCPGHETEAV